MKDKEDKQKGTGFFKISFKSMVILIIITILLSAGYSFGSIFLTKEDVSLKAPDQSNDKFLENFLCVDNFVSGLDRIKNSDYSWFMDVPPIHGKIFLNKNSYFHFKVNIAYVRDDKNFSRFLTSRRISIVDAVMQWASGKSFEYLNNIKNRCAIKSKIISIIKGLLYEPDKLLDISLSKYQITRTG